MSRRLKRQLGWVHDGQGVTPSPVRPPSATSERERRLNRILIIGGGGLAGGAVVVAALSSPFKPINLGINLAAIGIGLLMGKGIGQFIFRRTLPAARK
jgi:hypothetical protein